MPDSVDIAPHPSQPTISFNSNDNSSVPRPMRIACVVCRRRKLRCDGKKPSCGTCSRLGHECAYEEARRKSGPRRGYVKQLEARLAQVEVLLKGNDQSTASHSSANELDVPVALPTDVPELPGLPLFPNGAGNTVQLPTETRCQMGESYNESYGATDSGMRTDPAWDMISLGLEEPLPAQDVIDELDQFYFEKVHPTQPIIHPPRYFAAMKLAPSVRPPVALRYIMWSLAAAVSDKYEALHRHFYQLARKHAENEEMRDLGEHVIHLAYSQAWLLISMYEFKMISLPRAWLSIGKAVRLVLMQGLNRLDGEDLGIKLCLTPSKDWTEKEERRRVFWMAFCVDRYASAGTGWPMIIDERDISTNLPASEESFLKGEQQQTSCLADIISGGDISTLSALGSNVLLTCLIGREILHLHRPGSQDQEHDLNGEFWKRHRAYDNIMLRSALSAPSHLRLPNGIGDPNVIFWNMGIHCVIICLHQAAISKAEKNNLPDTITAESRRRCLAAADQTSSVMRMISHTDLSILSPFLSFCVYIAGRVFVQHLKLQPDDSAVRSSLEFTFAALNALKVKNPLAETFLVPLEVAYNETELRSTRTKDSIARLSLFKESLCSGIPSYPRPSESHIRQAQSTFLVESQAPIDVPKSATGTVPQYTGASSASDRNMRAAAQFQDPSVISADNDMRDLANSSSDNLPGVKAMNQQTAGMDRPHNFGFGGSSLDRPTMSTGSSSSNTSYSVSKGGQLSTPKFQLQSYPRTCEQVPTSYADGTNQIATTPEDTILTQLGGDPNTFASQLFIADTDALGSTAPVAPLSMPVSWSPLEVQPSMAGSTDITPGGIASLDEAQWVQFFTAADWGAWSQGN